MADLIRLTKQPIRVTYLATQPIYLAVDVSGYDQLDMSCYVPSIEGTGPFLVALRLLHGSQLDTDNGWAALDWFASFTASNQISVNTYTNFLRYIRWEVTNFSGAAAASFAISGMGRRHGRST